MNANLGELDVLKPNKPGLPVQKSTILCRPHNQRWVRALVLYHQASSCMKIPSHPYYAGDGSKLVLLHVQAMCVQAPKASGLVNGTVKGNKESKGNCLIGLRFRKSQF